MCCRADNCRGRQRQGARAPGWLPQPASTIGSRPKFRAGRGLRSRLALLQRFAGHSMEVSRNLLQCSLPCTPRLHIVRPHCRISTKISRFSMATRAWMGGSEVAEMWAVVGGSAFRFVSQVQVKSPVVRRHQIHPDFQQTCRPFDVGPANAGFLGVLRMSRQEAQ